MEYCSPIKREQIHDTHNNMDESQKGFIVQKKPGRKEHAVPDSTHMKF